jgi:hypothetical protein
MLVTYKTLLNAGTTVRTAKLVSFAHFAKSGLVTLGFITAVTAVHMAVAFAGYWKA